MRLIGNIQAFRNVRETNVHHSYTSNHDMTLSCLGPDLPKMKHDRTLGPTAKTRMTKERHTMLARIKDRATPSEATKKCCFATAMFT